MTFESRTFKNIKNIFILPFEFIVNFVIFKIVNFEI